MATRKRKLTLGSLQRLVNQLVEEHGSRCPVAVDVETLKENNPNHLDEWVHQTCNHAPECPECGRYESSGHSTRCKLGNLLARKAATRD